MAENFLKRWSRLKRALPAGPATADAAAPAAGVAAGVIPPLAPLPPVDGLELSSDFIPFMNGEVAEDLRRAALQKLFTAEHFNVMDGLDVYIDDYNKFEPIGEEMLHQLMQARSLLSDHSPQAAAAAATEPPAGEVVGSDDPVNGATDERA